MADGWLVEVRITTPDQAGEAVRARRGRRQCRRGSKKAPRRPAGREGNSHDAGVGSRFY